MQSLGGVELTQCLLPTVFATGVEFVRNMVRFQVKKQGKRFPSLGVKIMPFGTVTPMMWHVTTEHTFTLCDSWHDLDRNTAPPVTPMTSFLCVIGMLCCVAPSAKSSM